MSIDRAAVFDRYFKESQNGCGRSGQWIWDHLWTDNTYILNNSDTYPPHPMHGRGSSSAVKCVLGQR